MDKHLHQSKIFGEPESRQVNLLTKDLVESQLDQTGHCGKRHESHDRSPNRILSSSS